MREGVEHIEDLIGGVTAGAGVDVEVDLHACPIRVCYVEAHVRIHCAC